MCAFGAHHRQAFFHPLFATATHDVAKDKLVPAMQRSLKRQPETMLDGALAIPILLLPSL
jgi:hypothetical protein